VADLGIVTKEWVAVHRKATFARCETADDPHSPVISV
jgi:fatty-acid desaturase